MARNGNHRNMVAPDPQEFLWLDVFFQAVQSHQSPFSMRAEFFASESLI